MSATTDAILREILQVDEEITKAVNTSAVETLMDKRLKLVQRLNEANAQLQDKTLLKG